MHRFSAAIAANNAIMDSGRLSKFSSQKSSSAAEPATAASQQPSEPQPEQQSPSGGGRVGLKNTKTKGDVVDSPKQTKSPSTSPPLSPATKKKSNSDQQAWELQPPFTQRPDTEAEDTDQDDDCDSSSSKESNSSSGNSNDDDDDETDDSDDDEDYWTYKPLVAYCGECFNVQIHEPNYKDEHKTCLCFWGDAVCCAKGFEFYLKENSTKGIFPCPKMSFFAKYSHFIIPYEDPKLQRACRLAFDKAKQKKQKK